ncbi:hypothetical protein [Salinimicrobium sp. TH3]|uniref:hypothetical protein n=1 Tax=Salinimicrobium sp. TH3 TaxID=2997342 RepID=UPI002273699D|nr:hypothetical protein [Salinimicrobium sp. TH3]MCY2685888.1 hypothetical protein [Salinimicrobium sp. TH3]
MKINSDFVWAIILLGLATAAFLLGMKKGSINAEDQLEKRIEEIRILENKNQQLSEELRSRGVYSYPQANIISKMQDSIAMVLITLNGKDPIQNLKVRRKVHYDYSLSKDTLYSQDVKFTDLGTLKPHNPSAFEIPLPGKEAAVHLEYEANRKQWHQYIWLRKPGNGTIKSFWVITNNNSVIIDRHIDPGFPTNKEGEVVLLKDRSINYADLEMNSIFSPKG